LLLGGECRSPTAYGSSLHDHPPVGQFVHRHRGKPPTPVEEQPVFVGQLLEHALPIVDDPAVKHEIVASSDWPKWVQLGELTRAHRLRGTGLTTPPPPGPKPLTAKHEVSSDFVC